MTAHDDYMSEIEGIAADADHSRENANVGFLQIHAHDDHCKQRYGMERDAAVTFSIEYAGDTPSRIWLQNMVSGRREPVEIEGHEAFLSYLIDVTLEVGEDHGRPWRGR
jgi:hypothetical protein